MYVFQDRSGQELALRAEGTAPVCRAYLEHGLFNAPQPVRLYYLGPTFRYERPQAGRYRQHHQFGVEAIGDADPVLDAEVIELATRFFVSLGLSGFSVQLNSIGCKLCQPDYLEVLKRHYEKRGDSLCADCKTRLEKNPLRLLDCKNEACRHAAETAPRIVDYLCAECRAHFQLVQGYLTALDLPFQINHRLVRGLDYYTRTVFEIQPKEEGGQSTIGGGGRYDNLIEELGGKPTPAVGFAAGVERIILNLQRQEVAVPHPPRPRVFVAYVGDGARAQAVTITSALRKAGLSVIMATSDRSLKAQMRHANSLGTHYAVIIGEQELETASVTLRDMQSNEQRSVPAADLDRILAQL